MKGTCGAIIISVEIHRTLEVNLGVIVGGCRLLEESEMMLCRGIPRSLSWMTGQWSPHSTAGEFGGISVKREVGNPIPNAECVSQLWRQMNMNFERQRGYYNSNNTSKLPTEDTVFSK